MKNDIQQIWKKWPTKRIFDKLLNTKKQFILSQRISTISQCLDYGTCFDDYYIKQIELMGIETTWCNRDKKLWKEIITVLSKSFDYNEEELEKYFNGKYSKYQISMAIWWKLELIWALEWISEWKWYNNIKNPKIKSIMRKLWNIWLIDNKSINSRMWIWDFSRIIYKGSELYNKKKGKTKNQTK